MIACCYMLEFIWKEEENKEGGFGLVLLIICRAEG